VRVGVVRNEERGTRLDNELVSGPGHCSDEYGYYRIVQGVKVRDRDFECRHAPASIRISKAYEERLKLALALGNRD
jgi:hypothetical protein